MEQEPIKGYHFRDKYKHHFQYLIDDGKDFVRVVHKDEETGDPYYFLILREDVHKLVKSRAFRMFLMLYRVMKKDFMRD